MGDLPYAKKSLGQHWLTDFGTLQAICAEASVGPDDTILEIGPGLGTLTELLVHEAQKVIAVEYDAKLAAELPSRVGEDNLEVCNEDILSFDFTSVAAPYKVVANIPYYLTSNLIRVLSETPNPPELATLLIQQEVAERIAAKPGHMSILSVTAQFYWDVTLGPVVPAAMFTPPPKVESQVITLHYRKLPLFGDIDEKSFFRVVKAGFSQKRKTLLNSLSGGMRLSKHEVKAWCERAGIEPTRRAQTLSLREWQLLTQTAQA